jgi:autotransporter-associated beta strand protein
MTMKTHWIALGLLFSAGAVYAATNTWDGGGGANVNWSTAANWNPDGNVPVSASDTWLKFDGTGATPQQDIASLFQLNRLDFLGGPLTTVFTIGGGPLQFVTNGVTNPRIYLNRNASCAITNSIEIAAGATLIAEIGTYGVTLGGAITGGGAIDKLANAGGLTFNVANTFSGGLIVRANNDDWCKVSINASGAMGTGPVSLYGGTMVTNKTNPGGLNLYNTATHTNPISLFAHSPIFAAMPNGNNANVTLNGNIDLNTYTLHLRGGGAGTIGGVISEGASSAVTKTDAGTWTLNAANTFQGRVTLVNGTLKLGAAGSLDPQVGLAFSCATGWYTVAHATFDLNGRSMAVSQLSGVTTHPWQTNILTSATAATLLVNQSASTVFNGRLTGALSLVKDGAGTLTLSNYPSATSGGVTVSNGTLAVVSGASLGASSVTAAGGRLELRAASAIADAATLSVADGAKVLLAGGSVETVDRLVVNGVPQPRGYYGTTASGAMYADDAHFEGAGLLYVTTSPTITPTTVTWDAGGAADVLLSTAANWDGDAVPPFDGTNRAVFATGGITAAVDVAANLYGMTFNRDGTFVLAAGAGVISNGAGGIAAAVPTTAARTYTLAEDLVLTDHQTWNAATNLGAASVVMTGAIDDGFLPCNITKTGFAPLELRANSTFDGTFTVTEGDVRIYQPQALGSTNGNTVVNGGAGGRLYLYGGLTVAEPLVLNGERNSGGTLIVGSGSNVVSGPITCYNQVRLQGYNGPLVVTGGATAGDSAGLFVINSGSVITFLDKPLNLGTRTFWSDSGGVAVLGVAGNTWGDTVCAGGGIRCNLPDVLPPTVPMRIGIGDYRPDCLLDLNGNNQTCSRLSIGATVPGARVITSATPALLTVNQSDSSLADPRFTGAVSLLKLGAGNLTLTNASSSTAGSFAVSNGTLTVARDGTFGPNSMRVLVGGTGTLTLSNSVAIADTATLRIADGGAAKVHLAPGVNEAVGYLYLGSKQKRVGTYGSTASSATVKDDAHFAGTGILTVLRDDSGTLIKMH